MTTGTAQRFLSMEWSSSGATTTSGGFLFKISTVLSSQSPACIYVELNSPAVEVAGRHFDVGVKVPLTPTDTSYILDIRRTNKMSESLIYWVKLDDLHQKGWLSPVVAITSSPPLTLLTVSSP
ncbi:uncharacterized protein LOC101863130, partial [Aplysia californica]|uniref:Uncharacterized protein LOC101863130 n=1 Tax=Aplysia californica TaxID=6500 RepID=A0ABM0K351_APLCA